MEQNKENLFTVSDNGETNVNIYLEQIIPLNKIIFIKVKNGIPYLNLNLQNKIEDNQLNKQN